MNPKVKLVLYVMLLGCMAVLGYGLHSTYHAPAETTRPGALSTNVVASTNQIASTNLADATNLASLTNQATGTNVASLSNLTAVQASDPPDDAPLRRSSPRLSRMMGIGAAMLLCLVALALLIGNDASRYFANRMDDFIFNDNLEGVKDPEYEEAERVWASGQHLDALQLMRNYLKKHPREQYVALRIAEIYETDLNNYLAAALEYEEVLKRKLPAERWGWAAIHLANIYSGKLNKTAQATVLLRRIVDEYGQTAAAKKARERLGVPEPVAIVPPPAPEPEPEPEKIPLPPSNLPPGFRPK